MQTPDKTESIFHDDPEFSGYLEQKVAEISVFEKGLNTHMLIHSNMQFYGLLAAVGLVIALAIFGLESFAVNMYPALSTIISVLFWLSVLLTVVLAVPKKTRLQGAHFAAISAYLLLASLWTSSLMIAIVFAGAVWTIIGLAIFGFGVIGIAFIFTLFNGRWDLALIIAVTAVVLWILRWVNLFLLAKAAPPMPDAD